MATMATQWNTVAPSVESQPHGWENIGKSRLAMELYNWENHRTSHGALVWEIIELNEVYFMVFFSKPCWITRGYAIAKTLPLYMEAGRTDPGEIHCIHLLTREKKKFQYTPVIGC